MSNKKVNAANLAARGALSIQDLEKLLGSVSSGAANAERQQHKNEESKRQNEIAYLISKNKFDRASAEILLNNSWLQKAYIDPACQHNARVKQIREARGIVLTIDTRQDRGDSARVKVTERGGFVVVDEPQGEILQQIIAKLDPQNAEPQRNLLRVTKDDRFEKS